MNFRISVIGVFFLACGWFGLTGCTQERAVERSASEKLEKAESLVRILDFEGARELLLTTRPLFEKGEPQWSRSTYLLAVSDRFIKPVVPERIREAESLLEELFRESGNPELRSQAALDLGRLREREDYPGEPTDLAKARSWYREAEAIAPGIDMIARSRLRLAFSYAKQLEKEPVQEAITILKEFLSEHPDNPWSSVTLQYIGDLYAFWLNDTAAGFPYYERAYERGFSIETLTDRFLWRIIVWAEENNRPEKVIQYASELIDGYPRSTYQTLAREKIQTARDELKAREKATS